MTAAKSDGLKAMFIGKCTGHGLSTRRFGAGAAALHRGYGKVKVADRPFEDEERSVRGGT